MGVIKGGVRAKSANAYNWDLCHKIINTVRQEKGMALSTEENPYLLTPTPAKKEKSEEKSMVL